MREAVHVHLIPPTMTDTETLQQKLEDAITERDRLRAALVEARLVVIEAQVTDHHKRLVPLEVGQIKAQTIYALFAGNGLLSIIALVKIFSI